MQRFISALPLVLSLAVPCAQAARDIDPASLADGKVVIRDLSKADEAGKTYLAGAIIAAPVARLCTILQNYPDYPSFMPNTDKAQVVKAEAGASLVDMRLKLPLGKIKQYRLRMEAKTSANACHLAWKLVPRPELTPDETIADTSGYWQLAPLANDPAKTLVKYRVYSDPGPVPMGLGWIVDSLGKDSLPKTLEALRKKAGG